MNRYVTIIGLLFLVFSLGLPAAGPMPAPLDPVVKIEGKKDLFQFGDFYVAGQPNLETLRWLKSVGVTLVINLRSEAETKEFAASSFNEENMVAELGISYCWIPIGEKESYSPKTVDRFAEVLKGAKGKVLVHCASAGRATNLWVAYLVRCRGYSLDDAVVIGKQMKFAFPLEDFLGTPISLTLAEKKR